MNGDEIVVQYEITADGTSRVANHREIHLLKKNLSAYELRDFMLMNDKAAFDGREEMRRRLVTTVSTSYCRHIPKTSKMKAGTECQPPQGITTTDGLVSDVKRALTAFPHVDFDGEVSVDWRTIGIYDEQRGTELINSAFVEKG